MKPRECYIKNFKNIPSLSAVLPYSGLVMVIGDNGTGKSSFLQVLDTMLKGGTTNNFLSNGKVNGEVVYNFIAENGDEYTLRLDLDPKSGSNRFTLRNPNGKVSRSISDVIDLFEHPNITVEDFIDYGKTTEGSRKQTQIVLQMLPEDMQKQYADLMNDEKEAYNERTILGRELTKKKGAVETARPLLETVAEADMLPIYLEEQEAIKTQLADFTERDELKEVANGMLVLINAKKETLDSYRSQYKECEREIARLKALIAEQEAKQLGLKEKANLVQQEIDGREKEMNATLERVTAADEKLKTFDEGSYKALTNRRLELEKLISNSVLSQAAVENYNALLKEFEAIKMEHYAEEERIDGIRRAKRLIMTSELPVEGLYVEDDVLYIEQEGNLYRFNSNEVSESLLMLKTVEIIKSISRKSRVILISRGHAFSDTRLKVLHDMAMKSDNIFILEWKETGSDLHIVAYEDYVNLNKS